MQKYQKIKTENSAKILSNLLKLPNSGGKIGGYWNQIFSRQSNTGSVLTEIS